MKREEDARFAFARERRPNFPKTSTQRPTHRQTNGPTELHFRDVAADRLLVLSRQFLQPIPNRLAAQGRPPEAERNRLKAARHLYIKHVCIKYGTPCKQIARIANSIKGCITLSHHTMVRGGVAPRANVTFRQQRKGQAKASPLPFAPSVDEEPFVVAEASTAGARRAVWV